MDLNFLLSVFAVIGFLSYYILPTFYRILIKKVTELDNYPIKGKCEYCMKYNGRYWVFIPMGIIGSKSMIVCKGCLKTTWNYCQKYIENPFIQTDIKTYDDFIEMIKEREIIYRQIEKEEERKREK